MTEAPTTESVGIYKLQGRSHSEAIASGDAGQFEVLMIDDLQIDHSYQRDLDVDLVQRIAKDYDIAAAGPLVVSRRSDGSLFIVNGQHRAAGAKTAGESEVIAQVIDLTHLPVDEARKAEAELRLKGNTRRADKVQERFRAQLAAGYRESIAIVEIAAQFGTRINPWPDTKHGINAVSTIEELYRKDRGGHLIRVFEFIQDAFGQVDGPSATTALLKGVSWLLERHGGDQDFDRSRMVEKVSTKGVDHLMREALAHRAAMGGAVWMNFYRAMVGTYNERLPETRHIVWRTTASAKRRAEEDRQRQAESA